MTAEKGQYAEEAEVDVVSVNTQAAVVFSGPSEKAMFSLAGTTGTQIASSVFLMTGKKKVDYVLLYDFFGVFLCVLFCFVSFFFFCFFFEQNLGFGFSNNQSTKWPVFAVFAQKTTVSCKNNLFFVIFTK